MLGLVLTLLVVPAVLAHPIEHAHVDSRALGARWWHDDGHPAYRLFARQSNNSAGGYPAVGSAEWSKKYPPGTPPVSGIPKAWTDALAKAVADGSIPSDCPVSTLANGVPAYKNNSGTMNPGKQPICSSSSQCKGDGQIYDAPDGIVAISFDDGPLPPAKALYQFLRENNQKATHFYIGTNILQNSALLVEAFEENDDDIAVHTWTHPYMTTLSNENVLAELGWTMQIIHDSTGGRLPRFWRPPYGDSDNRVRAIAREIFGLTTVIWNGDTNDWAITDGATQTVSGASKVLQKAYKGPKSPGLVILEHELSSQSVTVFMNNYPLIAQNGWVAKSIPDAVGASWYLNSEDNTSPVTALNVSDPIPSNAASGGGSSSTNAGGSSSTSTSVTGSPTNTAAASTVSKSSALPIVAWSSWLGLAALVPMSLTLF